MKEILQTNILNPGSINASVICAFIHTHMHPFHVENAVQDLQTVEVEEPEAEYQEQPESEYEVVDQASDQDFTNTDTQQGKPRCILTQCRYISLSLMQILNISMH